jgi:hypothetical protein
MSILRAPLIAALTMVSCTTFAQQGTVIIITPDSEHIYSSDPARAGEILDDDALQLQNERAFKAKIWREQREDARRREELDAERIRAERDQAAPTAYEEPQSDHVWSYGGPFSSRQFRRAFGSGRQIRAGAAPSGAPAAVSSSHHR